MKRKLWDIREFSKVNLPEVVCRINDQERFSQNNGIRVLDLPIYMPDQGWRIPKLIARQFMNAIHAAAVCEDKFDGGYMNDHYVYITIDQKTVLAGKTGRRAGAHSDAYIERSNEQVDVTLENADIIAREIGEVSHTYIVTDCLPTEFFDVPFPIEQTECNQVLKTFDEIADRSTPILYPAYTLLRLDPYVVHRCAVCHKDTPRTFVKISFSRKRYNRQGNTHNNLFDYAWKLEPRYKETRNHPFNM